MTLNPILKNLNIEKLAKYYEKLQADYLKNPITDRKQKQRKIKKTKTC